jgi:GH18 family chitinase
MATRSWVREMEIGLPAANAVPLASRARAAAALLLGAAILACGSAKTGGSHGTPPADSGPTITVQPQAQSVVAPSAATFTVSATCSSALRYQWTRGGTAIAGATAATYTTPATTIAGDDGAVFRVRVSCATRSVTSDPATLTVTAAPVAPSITTQPKAASVTAGQTATFSVVASGTAPLGYQWQRNGTDISGATSASYTTPATTTADSGAQFRVIVSNSAGSATSNAATLTVTAAPVAPSITTQPKAATVTAGQTATFTVVASGTAPLGYQWQKNGTSISGATSASYTTPATTTADNGAQFRVVVSNTAGTVTSNAATLTVTTAPPPSTTWVMGYVPMWATTAAKVDFSAMTHMGLADLMVRDDGTVYYESGSESVVPSFVTAAHQAGVKALVMIGGSDSSVAIGNAIAHGHQAALVDNLAAKIASGNFDGIDINWEDNIPSDVNKVRDFVAAMRSRLPSGAIITYTWLWLDGTPSFPDVGKAAIDGGADRLNIMTYQLDGWGYLDFTWAASALYKMASAPTDNTVEANVAGYTAAGVPKSKLSIGIGLYPDRFASFAPWKQGTAYTSGTTVVAGYSVYQATKAGTAGGTKPSGFGTSISDGGVTWKYVGQIGLGQPTATVSSAGIGDDVTNGSVWAYANQGVRFFDSETCSSSLLFPDDVQARGFISWEDPRSIAAKAHYVRSNGLGGVIVWTTAYGDTGSGNPFMDAIKKHFLGAAMPADVRVTPAPANVKQGAKQTFSATVEDAADPTVKWSVVEPGGGTIDADTGLYTAPVQAGVYHVRATLTDPSDIYADSTVTVK